MMRFIFLVLSLSCSLGVQAQLISITPANVTFINDTSSIICNNADSIVLDLDSDSIIDIKIQRFKQAANCQGAYASQELKFGNYDGARVLARQNWNVNQTVAEEFNIGQSINPQNYWTDAFGYFYFYWRFQTGPTSCTTFIDGNFAMVPAQHNFLVKKTDSSTTNYYLFTLEYSNNNNCYQMVKPTVVGISEQRKAERKVYTSQGQLTIELESVYKPQTATLFDLQGRRVKSFRVDQRISRRDVSELKAGIYFLRLANERKAHKLLIRP